MRARSWLILLLIAAASSSCSCLRGRVAAGAGGSARVAQQGAQSLILQPTGLARGQAPAPLAAGAVRIALIGDFGNGSPEEQAVARLVLGWDPAVLVTAGDNVRPDPNEGRLDSHVGGVYGSLPGAARGGAPEASRRFWPVPGNHDWHASDGIQTYLDYFRLPGNGRYYDASIAGGRVHLFALDSDAHEPDGVGEHSAQALWLEPRLRASKACLNLVVFHHPPFSSGEHGGAAELRWPFRAWGAGAVVSGHDHTYERLEVDGLPYFVDGLGGAPAYRFGAPLPETKVRWNQKHGALLLTVAPESLTWEFWTWDGERVDRLEQPAHCPAPAAR